MQKGYITRASLILTFFILLIFSNYTFCQNSEYYQGKGDDFLKAQDYKQAVDCFTKALNSNKNDEVNPDLLYRRRAFCKVKLKLINQAVSDYSDAIKANPQDDLSYWGRGIAYNMNENYQLAINDYTMVLAFLQNSNYKSAAILYDNIAVDETKLKHYSNAIRADSVAIMANSEYGQAYWNRAVAYNYANEDHLAIADYTTAMTYYQDNKLVLPNLYAGRAVSERQLKEYKDAINDFTAAIQINPDKRYYWDRGNVYFINGDYELSVDDNNTAIDFYKAGNDNKALARLYDNLALGEARLFQFSKAILDDSIAVSINPQYDLGYWNMGNTYTQNGQYQQGINSYKKTINFFLDNKKRSARLYEQMANNEYFLKNYQKVVDYCITSINLDPGFMGAYYTIAKAYFKLNNKDMAILNFKKTLKIDSTKQSTSYIFSLYYIGSGNEAFKILSGKILSATNTAEIVSDYYNMACLLSLMNKIDDANIYLKKAIDRGYSKSYALQDEDLDNLKNTTDYKEIFANNTSK